MVKELKHSVFLANQELVNFRLVIFTWGNVSGIDRKEGLVVIKPSGVGYGEMTPEDMVVLDLQGKVIEGKYKPSSDTATHLEIYRNFKSVSGIVHAHSQWATSWAQAGRPIPVFGTTHADYFLGEIPCTRPMSKGEIQGDYELETGKLIVSTFKNLDPEAVPGVLVNGHGPFTWGDSPANAVHNAVVLEYIAKMAFNTVMLGKVNPVSDSLLTKHFLRKHGKDAYYGQNG